MSNTEAGARGSFATNLGFVLAAVGSAVGLGNIWKFPYITGVYGGGAFVLVYLGCVALVGLPLMYAELIIGRRGGKDILGALRSLTARMGLAGRVLSYFAGWLAVAAGFLILSFYSVVAGWAIHFFFVSLGLVPGSQLGAEGVFSALQESAAVSSLWHSVFMLLTVVVVAAGVHNGIELLCKLLMPALVVILIGLLAYVGVTGGLRESLAFLFKPDFGKLSEDAVLEALGHAFFTLSLGMGAMVVYGSYLREERRVLRDGFVVAVMDTVIALMAGAVIFAVVFRAGGNAEGGPGLLFMTLPKLFADMPGGAVVSSVFFLLVIFAAWSSSVSLLEVVVSYLVDEWRWNRKAAACTMGALIWAVGLLPAFSVVAFQIDGKDYAMFDLLDDATTRYMLPIGGFCIAVAAGWFISRQDQLSGFAHLGNLGAVLGMLWTVVIRFITPVLVLLVILWKVGLLKLIQDQLLALVQIG